jgi:site-specific DNA-methyltransferase (adenine-specific)
MELNKVICGDSLEYMKTLPDKCIDLVLTDPPYWINADKWVWWFWSSKTNKVYNDNWDSFTPSQEHFDEILRIWKQVIIFWWQFFTDKLAMNWHWIVWDKVWDIQFDNPFWKCELARTNLSKVSVNKYTVIQQGFISLEKKRYHPTQKPVKLFSDIIRDYSKEWDIILDCFAWSFTTAVACIETGRNYICIEKEEKYCAIWEKRIKNTTPPLFVI